MFLATPALLPSDVLAANHLKSVSQSPVKTVAEAENIVNNIAGWIQTFFFIIAIIFIILAAFQYLTAQGEPEKLTKARTMIIYAIVAIVVALVAGGMKGLADTFLTTNKTP